MTLFIDLRATPSGGIVAGEAIAWENGNVLVPAAEFAARVRGRDLFIATHGFNVSRQSGINALSKWSQECTLPPSHLFVGVLWPGDSSCLPFIDYVYEGVEAIASGKLLAGYLNRNALMAESFAFASHSLGARVVLETVRGLNCRSRRVVLMAGAIENDCLTREYADAAAKITEIRVLASSSDLVLKMAFPAGNLVGEMLMHGHPYDRTALGRSGPARSRPAEPDVSTWFLPDSWNYGHLDYLPGQDLSPAFPLPIQAPGPDSKVPVGDNDPGSDGWKPAWSAAAAATALR